MNVLKDYGDELPQALQHAAHPYLPYPIRQDKSYDDRRIWTTLLKPLINDSAQLETRTRDLCC
jgi:hypothetical protein